MNAVFYNRCDAGQKLAQKLTVYTNNPDVIVLALPRGGVPVAYEIAQSLNLPLDVCLVRKIGLPDNPETAMGAISLRHSFACAENALINDDSDYITIVDRSRIDSYQVEQSQIQTVAAKEKAELKCRETRYYHCRPMLTVSDRTVILVDDGIATGLTMYAAVEALSRQQPAKIIIAVPVASWQAIATLEGEVDNLICLEVPKTLGAVGFWYEDFSQTTDEEVCNLLQRQNCQYFAESR